MILDYRDIISLDYQKYMVCNKVLYNNKEYYYLSNLDNPTVKIVYRENNEMFEVTDTSQLKIILDKMCRNARVILNI